MTSLGEVGSRRNRLPNARVGLGLVLEAQGRMESEIGVSIGRFGSVRFLLIFIKLNRID